MKIFAFITSLLLLIGIMPDAALAAKNKKPKIKNVTFEGNHTFDDKRLLKLMLSRPSGFLRSSDYYPEILETDIENIINFYHQNGYLEVSINTPEVKSDTLYNLVDIFLKITEGEVTRLEGMTVFGNRAFPDSTLLDLVDLKNGDPFARLHVQDGMMAMISLYAENGYLDATIKPEIKINPEAHLAVVDFTVTEKQSATVSEIRIEGLKKTRLNIVLRELTFARGKTIRYSKLLTSQRQLYMTGLFSSVFIRPVPAESGSPAERDILVEVKEELSSEFNTSIGFGTLDRVRGKAELLTTNLSGTARKAGGSISASFIRRAAELSFTEPWTLGTRLHTDLRLIFEFLEEPGYDLSRYGGRITIGRDIGENIVISLSYRHENSELRHVETDVQPDNFEPKIRSFILGISRDTRNNLFNSIDGSYLEWTNEIAGTFLSGTNSFARSIFRLKRFVILDRKTVLASAMEIGWIDNFKDEEEIPLSERFYAGGPSTIRGFGYKLVGPRDDDGDPIGGEFMVTLNLLEVRRALYKFIGVAFFADIGNVWTNINDVDLADLRPSAGTGLRVNTPLGIVRLDYGINLDRRGEEPRDKIFFSMGQAF